MWRRPLGYTKGWGYCCRCRYYYYYYELLLSEESQVRCPFEISMLCPAISCPEMILYRRESIKFYVWKVKPMGMSSIQRTGFNSQLHCPCKAPWLGSSGFSRRLLTSVTSAPYRTVIAIICVSALHPLHFEQSMTFTGQAGGGVLLLAGKQLFLAAASANAQKTELAKEVLSPWILQWTIWSLNYWQFFIIYLVQPLNSTFRKQQQPKSIWSPFQDYSF